jgi:hypothetical protein
MKYEDFCWYIHPDPRQEGQYFQQIVLAPNSNYVMEDQPICDLNELNDDLITALEDPDAEIDLVELESFGKDLLHCLTNAGSVAVADSYRASMTSLREHPLRLTLEIVAPELINLPWEYLYDPSERVFLAHHPRVSLVRGLRGGGDDPDPLSAPLRMLVVIANPDGTPADIPILDVQQKLKPALQGPEQAGLLEVEWMPPLGHQQPPASRSAFLGRIESIIENEDALIHIVHFVCHGRAGYYEGSGEILLEGEGRRKEPVEAGELGQYLRYVPSIRLVLLSSCSTARTNLGDAFSGVAQALISYGVPAVVGMQHEMPLEVAEDFAKAFYGTFFDRFERGDPEGAMETALSKARREVWAIHHLTNPRWGTPVLYVRARAGDPLPLLPPPAAVPGPAQDEVQQLIPRLAYLRQMLASLAEYGDAPWALNAAQELQASIGGIENRLQALGMAPDSGGAATDVSDVQPPPPSPPPSSVDFYDRQYLIRLRDLIIDRLSLQDMEDICYEVGIDFENFTGGKRAKALDLVQYLERRRRVADFLRVAKNQRSDIDWDSINNG